MEPRPVWIHGLGDVAAALVRNHGQQMYDHNAAVHAVADSSGVYASWKPFTLEHLRSIVDYKQDRKPGEPKPSLRNFPWNRQVQRMEPGDAAAFIFHNGILIDTASTDTSLALSLMHDQGSARIIAANKQGLASTTADYGVIQDLFGDVVNGWHRARATVGGDSGVPDYLIDIIHQHTPKQLTIEGCVSGTLVYTTNVLRQGKSLSGAVAQAIKDGYPEPQPWDDYSGKDMMRKALILGRIVGAAYDVPFEHIAVDHHSFMDPVLPAGFDVGSIERLQGEAFVEEMKQYDPKFADLAATVPAGKILRYVATVDYDETRAVPDRIKITTGFKHVPADSLIGDQLVDGLNAVSFGKYGGMPPGKGAGYEVTAQSIMRDFAKVIEH